MANDCEHLDRFLAMLEDDGDTWDLSENDKAAIRWILNERQVLTGKLEQAEADRDKIAKEFRELEQYCTKNGI